MSFMQKLKSINRKWIYIAAAVLIVLVAGSIAGRVLHRGFEMRYMKSQIENSNPIYHDILYLENTSALKLAPDQAKAMIPLAEKMNTATDKTVKSDLSKQLYSLLTPQQYQALSTGGNNRGSMGPGYGPQSNPNNGMEKRNGRDGNEKGRMDSHRFGAGYSNGYNNAREKALPDVVMKLLKTRSEEPSKQ